MKQIRNNSSLQNLRPRENLRIDIWWVSRAFILISIITLRGWFEKSVKKLKVFYFSGSAILIFQRNLFLTLFTSSYTILRTASSLKMKSLKSRGCPPSSKPNFIYLTIIVEESVLVIGKGFLLVNFNIRFSRGPVTIYNMHFVPNSFQGFFLDPTNRCFMLRCGCKIVWTRLLETYHLIIHFFNVEIHHGHHLSDYARTFRRVLYLNYGNIQSASCFCY